ncbi:protein kinase [Mycobacterium asiaticum]|nr:serine/threonine-protein kinase [Mycobacterium asiaticum]OBK94587.1 protein kinase [Mycobacterium asiaticum]
MIRLIHGGPGIGLHANDVFAGYKVLRFLGSGGMGEVYLAQHPRLPRQEALKILGSGVSADDDYRQRFIREADLAAALWHPNIVRINDRGEFNGQLWIAMDFVDGTDAASLLRDHYPAGMPADRVAQIVTAIASALDYAHRHHNLMHRDVSPANILLARAAAGDQRILLSDFGISRNIGDTSGLTATNMTIGTVPYAPPEQLTDEPLDGRADQYALAATAYHLLTGSPLFPHNNPAVVISRHLSAPPPSLAETHPMLRVFDPVLATALAKDPADRFPRCTDFADAFAEAVTSGRHPAASASTMPRPLAVRSPMASISAPTPTAAGAERGIAQRWRIFAAAATLLALTALGASGYPDDNGPGELRAQAPAPPALAQPQPVAQHAPPSAPTPPVAPVVGESAPPAPAPAPPPPASVPNAPAPKAPIPVAQRPSSPAPAAPAPQQSAPSPDQAYLNLVSEIPGVTVTDPTVAVNTGRNLCTVLQNGGSPNEVADATVNSNQGITPAQAAAGVNAAISVYCPQYLR